MERFPEIKKLLEGEAVDKTFCFVDLLGTKYLLSKYLKRISGDVSVTINQRSLAVLQTSFAAAYLSIANEHPSLTIAQASDSIFIIGDDPNEILEAVCKGIIYTSFHFNSKDTPLIPMRAALSKGLIRVAANQQALTAQTNFHSLPYCGPALAKSYLMEQLGPKGMCIYLTESVKASLNTSCQDSVEQSPSGVVDIHGEGKENYYSFNWLIHPPIGGSVYMKSVIEYAEVLAKNGSDPQKRIGSSILKMTGHERYKKLIYKESLAKKLLKKACLKILSL